MKHVLTISFLFAFGAFAQDEPISDMYWNNYSYFNPAMSGVRDKHEANVSYRSQFSSYFGYPNNWYVNYGTNINEKHGLGLNYVHERAYYSQKNRIKLNYNYQLDLKGDRKLVFGAAVGFFRMGWIPEWSCYVCDPIFFYPLPRNIFQLDLGAAYYGENITAGLAITQIPIHGRPEYSNFFPHMTGNFRFDELLAFPRGSLFVETRFQTDFVRYRQDFNLGLNLGEFLEIGFGYRTSDALLVNLTGIIAKKYRIGYSYAHTINSMSSYSNGTHEIAIGLRIPNK